MRLRSVIALSAAALSALALAGCSAGSASPTASPTGTASAVSLCAAQVKPGAATKAITVSGEVGKPADVSFAKPLAVKTLQSSVVKKGTGAKLKAGDLVRFALTEYNAQTGAKNGTVGQEDGSLLPQPISPDSILGQALGCATVGTRVVATIPGDEQGAPSVDVVDVLGVVPGKAAGAAQAPVAGMPKVVDGKSGEPTVTLPKGAMPTAFQKATLIKGDGPTVATGDTVLVQYYGVSWNTKKTFDKSWGRQPFSFSVGQGVVKGFSDAVTGATVGSQIVAVLPPSDAYGEGKINSKDLTGQTLVFVVDILAVQHAAAG